MALEATLDHLLHNVVAAAADYRAAEQALTQVYNADPTSAAWETAARTAKRRAAEVAIAIDGLTDRCAPEIARCCSSPPIHNFTLATGEHRITSKYEKYDVRMARFGKISASTSA